MYSVDVLSWCTQLMCSVDKLSKKVKVKTNLCTLWYVSIFIKTSSWKRGHNFNPMSLGNLSRGAFSFIIYHSGSILLHWFNDLNLNLRGFVRFQISSHYKKFEIIKFLICNQNVYLKTSRNLLKLNSSWTLKYRQTSIIAH